MLKYLMSMMLCFMSLTSFSADFVAGKDYEVLKGVGGLTNSAKPSVIEFFSFGCPWCYRLEPALALWVKQHQTTIYFKKIPVVFNKDWEYYAKAYYAAEALTLSPALNAALFKSILKDKRSLKNDQAMIDFFVEQGVEPATAKSAFTYSTSIEMSVKDGRTLMALYHINAVPAFIVDNRFKTDLQMAKTEERLFAIVDFLIEQSKQQKV